jgi:hypothetical protein
MRDFTGVSGASGGDAKVAPAPATQWTPAVANSWKNELKNVILHPSSGIGALNGGDDTQLVTALLAIIAASGAGVDVTTGSYEHTISIGGLILKVGNHLGFFGESSLYTAFETPFPNDCWGAFSMTRNDSGGTTRDIWPQAQGDPNAAGFTVKLNLGGGGTTNNIDGITYFAIGH